MQFAPAPKHQIHAVSIVCQRANEFLLIKRAKPAYKNWLAFPGGKVEKDESPKDAAKRELLEETNLHSSQLDHLITLNLGRKEILQKQYFLSVYYSHDYQGKAIAGDDAKAIYWLTLQQMLDYKVIPSVISVARQLIENELNK